MLHAAQGKEHGEGMAGRAENPAVGEGPAAFGPAEQAALTSANMPRSPRRAEPAGAREAGPDAVTSPPAASAHAPNPIDVHVGARVRLRRHLLNMSQKSLADALGMSFQQVQNFERGLNRIAAGRLHAISRILDVPVSYFFDALPPKGGDNRDAPPILRPAAVPGGADDDLLHQRETLDLIRAYYAMPDPALRKRVFDLIRSLTTEH